jgi:non-homologous end joining protein Ku
VAGDTFTEVPDEEIVKGYEYAKGQHVLMASASLPTQAQKEH